MTVLAVGGGILNALGVSEVTTAANRGAHAPVNPRPLLLVVCTDPAISRGVERELRRKYAPQGFDAACVDTCATARQFLESASVENRAIALVVAEHNGTDREAIELVRASRELHPDARTILTTPYSDMKLALDAMNQGVLDYFFIEPVRLDERAFPVVSDLLSDWKSWQEDAARAVRVVGRERTAETHMVCDFLARNDIHFQLIDADSDAGKSLAWLRKAETPMVLFSDGDALQRPSTLELAQRLRLPTEPKASSYDLIVIGGGPAGLAAAVYGASEGLETVLLEGFAPGGQAGQSSKIENYLGFPSGLRGGDLAQRALRQARRFGAEIVRLQRAESIRADDGKRVIRLAGGGELECRSALIATGVDYRRIDAPGVEELVGRGVYYGAAVADAKDYEGREVLIVGGANSAGQAALHFSDYASRVTMLVRADSLKRRMSQYLVQRIEGCPTIDVLIDTAVVGAGGSDCLETVALKVGGADERTISADVMFVFIGAAPRTEWLAGCVALDDRGFVLSGRDLVRSAHDWSLDRDPMPLETSMPGVFVAGDIRHGSIKRVASAVGEGSMAVQLVHQHLAEADSEPTA